MRRALYVSLDILLSPVISAGKPVSFANMRSNIASIALKVFCIYLRLKIIVMIQQAIAAAVIMMISIPVTPSPKHTPCRVLFSVSLGSSVRPRFLSVNG